MTLKFRPDGRQFLYTEEDIGKLVIGLYIPILEAAGHLRAHFKFTAPDAATALQRVTV